MRRYGDTCKFLHDRSDYKAGWQLDREWDEKQKAEKAKQMKMLKRAREGKDSESEAAEESSDEDGFCLPVACQNCGTRWEDLDSGPVVTDRGEYFSENCALNLMAETGGIFNAVPERELEKLQKRQKKRQKKTEDVESDDD